MTSFFWSVWDMLVQLTDNCFTLINSRITIGDFSISFFEILTSGAFITFIVAMLVKKIIK